MHAEDDTTAKRRRNLMATSIVICIYILSGAKITKLGVGAAAADIPHAGVVEVAFLLLFLFYLFRFWQTNPRPYKKTLNFVIEDTGDYVPARLKFVEMIEARVERNLQDGAEFAGRVWGDDVPEDTLPKSAKWTGGIKNYTRGLFKRTATVQVHDVHGRNKSTDTYQLPFLGAEMCEIRTLIVRGIIYGDLFWETWFPYLLASATVTLAYMKAYVAPKGDVYAYLFGG